MVFDYYWCFIWIDHKIGVFKASKIWSKIWFSAYIDNRWVHFKLYLFENILHFIPDFYDLEEPQKLISIITNLDNTAAKFIDDCFEIRTFLLAEHKIND